jgi:hypothetical protein
MLLISKTIAVFTLLSFHDLMLFCVQSSSMV